jgi:hypothetical protein
LIPRHRGFDAGFDVLGGFVPISGRGGGRGSFLDTNGQALAYVYRRATETDAMQAKVLTDDEARRVAITLRGCRSFWGRKNEDRAETGRGRP